MTTTTTSPTTVAAQRFVALSARHAALRAAGCDIELSDSGRCAQAMASESEEDKDARIERERASWGLPPLTPPDPTDTARD